MTENEIALIKRLWDNGQTIGSIARLFPYKEYIVKREIQALKKSGVLSGKSGKNKELTLQKLKETYESGITNPYEMAKTLDMSVGTIREYLGDLGIKLGRNKKNYNKTKLCEKTNIIIEELKNGKTARQISQQYQVSTQYVYEIKGKFLKGE